MTSIRRKYSVFPEMEEGYEDDCSENLWKDISELMLSPISIPRKEVTQCLPGHANTQREVVGHLSLRTSTAPSCISEGGNKPLRKIKSTHPIPVKDSEVRPGKSLDLMSRPEGQESSSLTGTNGSGSSNCSGSRHESSQRMSDQEARSINFLSNHKFQRRSRIKSQHYDKFKAKMVAEKLEREHRSEAGEDIIQELIDRCRELLAML
ncbi:hypothetical protein PNOK_0613100 [Pyrrhoderma noxium]|uniref:Uncharacterized protein n=1 Tax=Pyrrhoderma noxium TaxID=2282107 RepID=A0A286UDT1_9AGAM|nr:hypothetical protein PNOK_0613100 [Pyrrhoderma noxium]